MSSRFGMMDALQRECDQFVVDARHFFTLASPVISCDRKVIETVRSTDEFNQRFADWVLSVRGVPPSMLQPEEITELRKHFRRKLFSDLHTRSFLHERAHHVQQLKDDSEHLMERLEASPVPDSRRDEIVDSITRVTAEMKSVLDDLNETLSYINNLQGIQVLHPADEYADDDDDDEVSGSPYNYLPADFNVPMFSQRMCAMEEIRSLQPLLETAIMSGNIDMAARLGARIAGLQASIRVLIPPPPPRKHYLALTL